MDIILIAGLWLPHTIWAGVSADLEGRGHRPLEVSLPGVDDGSATATLDDQLVAVLDAIDGATHPMVVGHSAACTLAWMAADRRPDVIAKAVLIGGFPAADGETYADFFPAVDGAIPFPGWGPFEGADSADLDAASRKRIESVAVPVPETVAKGTVRLTDERRFEVPTLMVCPEFTPDDARAWIAAGDVPELARTSNVEFVDIDSGHWPMVTRPRELAAIIAAAS